MKKFEHLGKGLSKTKMKKVAGATGEECDNSWMFILFINMQKLNTRIFLIFFCLVSSSVCVSQKEIRINLTEANDISSELGSTIRPTLVVISNGAQKTLAKKTQIRELYYCLIPT